MQRRKKSRTNKQRNHSKRRFRQRYGIDFNQQMRQEFRRLIQSNQCVLVEKQSNRISIWDVTYEGNVYRIVYDKQRKNVVTVLPELQITK